VTMYVDLLARALDDRNLAVGPGSYDALLADLVNSWGQLLACEIRGTPSAAEALARELSYDGALIRFCHALHVPTEPARFARPSQERARLERALAERGVTVDPR
jgi:hypothetical protein